MTGTPFRDARLEAAAALASPRPALRGVPAMVDLTDLERAAIRAVIKPVAEIMAEIGWLTRLCDLSEAQALTLIEVSVGGFQDAMHQAAKDPEEVPF